MAFFIKPEFVPSGIPVLIGDHAENIEDYLEYKGTSQYLRVERAVGNIIIYGSDLNVLETVEMNNRTVNTGGYTGRFSIRSIYCTPNQNKSISIGSLTIRQEASNYVSGPGGSLGTRLRYNTTINPIINGTPIGNIVPSGAYGYWQNNPSLGAFINTAFCVPLERTVYLTNTDDVILTEKFSQLHTGLQSEAPMFMITVKEGEQIPNVTEVALWIAGDTIRTDSWSTDPEGASSGLGYYLLNNTVRDERLINWINSLESYTPEDVPDFPDPPVLPVENPESDPIPIPTLDILNQNSVLAKHLVSVYQINASEVNSIAQQLWSTDFVDSMKKLHDSPVENILKIHALPVIPTPDTRADLYIGNVKLLENRYILSNQFYELDCGIIQCPYYYQTALDLEETSAEIFLPFIGTETLDIKEILGAQLSLKYRIDAVTGNCLAILYVDKSEYGTHTQCPLYTYTGNCSLEFPMSQRTVDSMAAGSSMLGGVIGAVGSLASGNPLGFVGAIGSLVGGAVGSERASRVQTRRSGQSAGALGWMGCLTPYLTICRPIRVNPGQYEKHYGYPAFYNRKLQDCKGFTVVDRMITKRPNGISEQIWNDILEKLKEGVII